VQLPLGELLSKLSQLSASLSVVEQRCSREVEQTWKQVVEEERTFATCVFLNTVIIFGTDVGAGLVPDPLQRVEMDYEARKFVTRCFSLNLFRKE